MAKVKKGKHGLPQTDGQFKLKGLVSGTNKKDFFEQKPQTNGFERNTLKIGVKTSPENEVFVQISDSEKEDAWFYKQGDKKKDIEGQSKKVAWEQRHNFKEEGFTPIGVSIGLDKDDNKKNIVITKHDFDAAEYVKDRLEEDMAVLVVGDTEFSSFESQDGKIRAKKFKVKKIYNSAVDFEADDFAEESVFKQQFLFMNIDQAKKDGKVDNDDPRFIVTGKVVTYSSLEDIEFVIRNKKLAANFKKHLKPYNCITVHGKILNTRNAEEVVEDGGDDWGGESDPFNFINTPRKFELEIHGIDTKNIDTKTYSEEIVKNAFKANDEFGGDEWEGNESIGNSKDEDDFEW